MRSSTFRLRWQPPPIRFQTGVIRSCQRITSGSGARPCSANSRSPSGLRTRRISSRAAPASGMVHSVKVITTVSKLESSSGNFSLEASNKRTGNPTFATRWLALARSSAEGSTPYTVSISGRNDERLRPEPIPISSTRPCAAPAVRSRNGAKWMCCNFGGGTW